MEARVTQIHSRLLTTLDTLDQLQCSHNDEVAQLKRSNYMLEEKVLRLQAKLIETDSEYDDMREAVEGLIEKGLYQYSLPGTLMLTYYYPDVLNSGACEWVPLFAPQCFADELSDRWGYSPFGGILLSLAWMKIIRNHYMSLNRPPRGYHTTKSFAPLQTRWR